MEQNLLRRKRRRQSRKGCVWHSSDAEAFATVKELARREGVLAGSSSGAALAAALKLAQRIDHGSIVTVFPDRGDR